MKLILILVIITKNKIQVDNDGKKYILFRIDAYFTEYCLAIEIDEKGHTDGDPIFEQKREKVLEKKLIVRLLDLILVKKILMLIVKLVKYKHLLVILIKAK